jgi:hypothetical protein
MGKETKGKYETETTETETNLLDEMIENQKQQTLVDIQLSYEAGKEIAGLYDPIGIYNIPRKSESGKLDWGGLCDVIQCPYKNQDKHIHTVGVGIAGAKRAMSLYGNLEIMPDEPHMVDGEGEKLWSCTASGIDHHNKNQIKLTYMQSASIKTREGKIFRNENMPMIVQSKAIRNVILFLVPGSIQQKWIENYIAGKQPFENGKEGNIESLSSIMKRIEEFASIETLEAWFLQSSKNIKSRADYNSVLKTCKLKKRQLTILKLIEIGGFPGTTVSAWLDVEGNATIAEEALLGNVDAINQFKSDVSKIPEEKEEKETAGSEPGLPF